MKNGRSARRCLPLLRGPHLEMLRGHPYERPAFVTGTREVKLADELVSAGLLERDPSAPRLARCTAAGTEAARELSGAEAERLVDDVVDQISEDPEAAAALERALWQRVLAEVAAADWSLAEALLRDPRPLVRIRRLAEIALRTSCYDFPRGY